MVAMRFAQTLGKSPHVPDVSKNLPALGIGILRNWVISRDSGVDYLPIRPMGRQASVKRKRVSALYVTDRVPMSGKFRWYVAAVFLRC